MNESSITERVSLERLERLTCLKIAEDKRETIAADLNRISQFISKVQAVDTKGVEPLLSLAQE